MTTLAQRLALLQNRIETSCASNARALGDVQLIGVSKFQAAQYVIEASKLGITDFGENYLQEALLKIDTIGDKTLTWHFIGSIQSNLP